MCTSLRITATDHSSVIGRTMEFPTLMNAELTVIPRGMPLTSTAPDDAVGRAWTSTYGTVGIDAFPKILPGGNYSYTDGMNEKGLYGGLLYHPGFCEFSTTEGIANDHLVNPLHLIAYVLTTCATVAETRTALADITVWAYQPNIPVTLYAHYRFDDVDGDSIVVEWDHGVMRIFDNPIGVMTNSPNFDWHLTNLRNYINLRAEAVSAVKIGDVELAPLGIGTSMRGLPGDPTPPARFVRAVALSATAKPSPDATGAENMMLHLINNFDLPDGFAQASLDPPLEDQTLWSTISNLAERSFSVRTQADFTFRKIKLSNVDFTGTSIAAHPLPGAADFPEWSL
ncbi:MAG: linear amide C-N hydrolase [Candidatus Nanopelagicales bacterium]|jgi:choloylglycine hydrolase|nr:linear amide C-N hydrolase [Candidatus Nanopelagicales bacterium]